MPDITIEDHGSLYLLRPHTVDGTAWLNEHLNADVRFGCATACQPRYLDAILNLMILDGLEIE